VHVPHLFDQEVLVKNTRKPFVAPEIKEQASLAKVTLISGGGGGPTNHLKPHNHHT
jgi:hypothetical protein